MKQQSLKYPSRADMLELLKARERRTSRTEAAPANRVEYGGCIAIAPGTAR